MVKTLNRLRECNFSVILNSYLEFEKHIRIVNRIAKANLNTFILIKDFLSCHVKVLYREPVRFHDCHVVKKINMINFDNFF